MKKKNKKAIPKPLKMKDTKQERDKFWRNFTKYLRKRGN